MGGCNSCKRKRNLVNTIRLAMLHKKVNPGKTVIVYSTSLNSFNFCEKEFNNNYTIVKTL